MIMRDFEPGDIVVRCRICKTGHPKSEFPTIHKVCNECAHKMNWLVRNRKTGILQKA